MARKSTDKKGDRTLEEIQNLTVSLKPILGIHQRIYVPVIWALIVAILLFWVTLRPGIVHYESIVSFDSEPDHASVYVDGTRLGATPLILPVSAGERTVEFRHPYAPIFTETIEIPGRRFLSLFFPKRISIAAALDGYMYEDAHRASVIDFSRWSTVGIPSAQFQFPWIASEEALWCVEAAEKGVSQIDSGWIEDYLVHTSSPMQFADLVGAVAGYATKGGFFDSASLSRTVEYFIQLDADSTNLPQLSATLLSATPAGGVIETSEWYGKSEEIRGSSLLAASLELDEGPRDTGNRSRFFTSDGGVTSSLFVEIHGGRYIENYPLRSNTLFGISREIGDFSLQATEVSRREYAFFVAENPQWAPENRETLIFEGFAEEGYLSDWISASGGTYSWNGGGADDPVSNVSVYAAEAYAEWFTDKFLSGSGLTAGLPSKTEWEYAAFLNDAGEPTVNIRHGAPQSVAAGEAGSMDLHHMEGNVWEWTSSWHAENRDYLGEVRYGDMRIVVGGSFANTDTSYTRSGAQPPNWTTPYLGFRLALHSEELR